ncbi:glycoprotein 3-alpha-L-fucosyltransferase A [Hydra vulgaris]|uniref:glycoprotein 3-alpha-L-fucosyltransferase A n=1 Tax=Hydra vulgaris TaxID=6087 RepID=UPI0032E9D361
MRYMDFNYCKCFTFLKIKIIWCVFINRLLTMRITLKKTVVCTALLCYAILSCKLLKLSNFFTFSIFDNGANKIKKLSFNYERNPINNYDNKKIIYPNNQTLFVKNLDKDKPIAFQKRYVKDKIISTLNSKKSDNFITKSEYKDQAVNNAKLVNKTQNIQTDWTELIYFHKKVYNKYTDKELLDYFDREKISNQLFRYPLDIDSNRDLLKTLFPSPVERRDRVTDQLRLKLKTNTTKVILAYNNQADLISESKLKNCNVDKCVIKTDINYLSSADVVFFENTISLYSKQNLPKDQVWILYQLESPLNSPIQVNDNLVNWTATYRQDSVINTPYERFTPYLNISKFPKIPLRNYALNKSKTVAWFVSNCATQNERSTLAKELNKYIKVDIYGLCGTLECQRSDAGCFKKLKREYKFYLSFENSNCKDYVTEKLFWNAYENDVVPIVMGAHPNEYKNIAPPHSYIHVDDFPSVKDLAKYLIFLDQNDLYYNQYFLWKNTGSFIDTKFTCRLCAMAHLATLFPMWYSDLASWWKTETCRYSNSISWRNTKESVAYAQYVKYGYQRT